MRSFVWCVGVLAGALVGGLGSTFFTAALYLLIGETIFWFLSLGVNAIFAVFGAVMTGNALAVDGTRGRLLMISGVSEIAAIMVAFANLLLMDTASVSAISRFTLGERMAASTLIVVLITAIATWILRRSSHEEGKDGRTAAILPILTMLYVVGGMVLDGILVPIPA